MRAKELRERTDEELRGMLTDEKASLFNNRIKNATHQLEDTSALHKSRREIARIRTIVTQRETAASKASE